MLGFPMISMANGESGKDEMGKGRITVVLISTAYGALYGWGVPYLLDAESDRAYIGSEMVFTFGGFALSLMATRNYQAGPAVSNMIRGGTFIGTLYGIAIPALFKSGNEKAYVATTMITTPLGALAGYRLAPRDALSAGKAELTTFGGIVGMLYGLAVPYLAGIEDKEMKKLDRGRIYAGSVMLGIPAGVLAFNAASQRSPISKERARLIELGSCLGAYYGWEFTHLAKPGGDKPYVAAMMACLPAGTYGAYLLTGAGDYKHGRDTLIILGAFFGELFGSGIAYLAGAEWGDRPFTIGGMLGIPAGIFTATYLTRDFSQKKAESDKRLASVSFPAFEGSYQLAMLGIQSIFARHGNGIPIRVELCRVAF